MTGSPKTTDLGNEALEEVKVGSASATAPIKTRNDSGNRCPRRPRLWDPWRGTLRRRGASRECREALEADGVTTCEIKPLAGGQSQSQGSQGSAKARKGHLEAKPWALRLKLTRRLIGGGGES